jgi:membrane protein DedA with SNARE-associated domain
MILGIDTTSFTTALLTVTHIHYIAMFVIMVIEGPIITAVASFAVTMGYFNLGIIFILATFGDLIGDLVYYGIGYWGHINVIKKYGHRFGASPARMEKLRGLLERHPWKIMAAIKLSAILPPTLVLVGSTHFPFKKYLTIAFSITLPKVILFMSLGYFFGNIFNKIYIYIKNASYAFLIIVVFAVLIYYLYRKIAAKISKKLERS